VLEAIHADVTALATPERAKTNAWFFKTGPGQYGEGDIFAGLSVPQVRTLARKYRDLSLEDTEQLLHSQIHEERLLALMILVGRFKRAKRDAEARKQVYELYLANTAYINNWDLVDASAEHIVGAYLDGRANDVLSRLAASDSVWERRIAMISTFHSIKQGECSPALQIAEALLNDKHDLIHKATGWMLREAGKRCGRDLLQAFLDRHAETMPRTALRYAIEHFDPDLRRHYMTLKGSRAQSTGVIS
jgi:3-methyladenine DNA glycosylase AlkD